MLVAGLWLAAPVRAEPSGVPTPPDPQLAADVSNGVAQSYIENTFNIRFRSSSQLSSFMEKQMEELKAKMEKSGAALAQFQRELRFDRDIFAD